jgi:hypothetical protein
VCRRDGSDLPRSWFVAGLIKTDRICVIRYVYRVPILQCGCPFVLGFPYCWRFNLGYAGICTNTLLCSPYASCNHSKQTVLLNYDKDFFSARRTAPRTYCRLAMSKHRAWPQRVQGSTGSLVLQFTTGPLHRAKEAWTHHTWGCRLVKGRSIGKASVSQTAEKSDLSSWDGTWSEGGVSLCWRLDPDPEGTFSTETARCLDTLIVFGWKHFIGVTSNLTQTCFRI